MDKVKEFWDFFKRHHFWFIAGMVTVLAMLAGWMANSSLDAKYLAESAKIKDAQTKATSVSSMPKHPNAVTLEEMKKLKSARQIDVEKAWEKMYALQRESILVWPKQLTQEFRSEVKAVLGDDPIERIDTTKRDIPVHLRQEYRDYIAIELPKLAEIIHSEWMPKEKEQENGRNPAGPGVNQPMKKEPVVVWNEDNQKNLLAHRFSWPQGTPTTQQLLYAQEDLWVLTALIQIIKKTNGEAETRHKAAIREIDAILFGADVQGRVGQIYRPPVVLDPMNPMGPAPAAPPPMPLVPADPLAAAKSAADPATNRYVNQNYELLTGDALKEAVNSDAPDKAYAAVAKRIPIRMRLKMDTRKINKLLAECGNSPLPVEIRQVRIGCEPGVVNVAGPNNFGPPRLPPPGMREPGGIGPALPPRPGPAPGPRPGGPGPGPGGENANGEEQFPYDRYVELYGIIYIFNPVNKKQLLYSAEELAAMGVPAVAPGTTPMGTTPMGTAPAPMGVVPMGAPAPMPMPAPMGAPAPMPMVPAAVPAAPAK